MGVDFGLGAHIEVIGDTWYWFSRKVYRAGVSGAFTGCGLTPVGTEVRKSTDHGVTWSEPVQIIIPQEGKAWECGGTDGDAYYDDQENKWHYVFQCLERDRIWHACHLERQGSDPMGLFVETHVNPIPSLRDDNRTQGVWDDICNNPSDKCFQEAGGSNVGNGAGTLNFIEKRDGFYYLNFHGGSGYPQVKGYTGIAKTRDFVNWIAGDQNQGVPSDSIVNRSDLDNWRENWTISNDRYPSSANIIREGNYYYMLNEIAEYSISCTQNQNWDVGIFRTNSLTNSRWEQYPKGNPIVYSPRVRLANGIINGCGIQYARFIKDSNGKMYLMYFMEGDKEGGDGRDKNIEVYGVYFYELVPKSNLLENADLWKCTSQNWEKVSVAPNTTTFSVNRRPDLASEGVCFMEINCGAASCATGQGMYQDINIPAGFSRNIEYGGKFATYTGSGPLTIALFEYDVSGTNIGFSIFTTSVDNTYKLHEGLTRLKDQTTKVRFQIYLNSPLNFKADELFVQPTTKSKDQNVRQVYPHVMYRKVKICPHA